MRFIPAFHARRSGARKRLHRRKPFTFPSPSAASSTQRLINTMPAQLSPDDAYLSYHDVRLTREDVSCIKNDWLTDNAIAF